MSAYIIEMMPSADDNAEMQQVYRAPQRKGLHKQQPTLTHHVRKEPGPVTPHKPFRKAMVDVVGVEVSWVLSDRKRARHRCVLLLYRCERECSVLSDRPRADCFYLEQHWKYCRPSQAKNSRRAPRVRRSFETINNTPLFVCMSRLAWAIATLTAAVTALSAVWRSCGYCFAE